MKKLIYLLAAVVLLAACKPSVEGESKSWTSNLKNAETLKTKYPAFSQLIDDKVSTAKKVWDEAQSIVDEEAKAEKMREANGYFSSGSFSKLYDMDTALKNLDKERTKLLSKASGNANLDLRATEAGKEAKLAMDEANAVLFATGNMTVAEAENKINKAYTKIESAKKAMSSILSAISKEQSKNNSTNTNTSTDNKTDNTTTKKEEPQLVKCEYCGVKNEPTAAKCKGCGAPLK